MVGEAWKTRRLGGAFTLVEMLVVLAVIGIVAAILLPSTIGIFTAGADAQARNVLAGQLAAARSLAIQEGTYAGVHTQLADESPGARSKRFGGACFAAVVQQDPNDPNFYILAKGFSPRQLPGAMAFGHATGSFVNGTTYWAGSLVGPEFMHFTSVTVLFGPNGQLVMRQVDFDPNDPNDPIFYANDPNYSPRGSPAYLWDAGVANDPNCNWSVEAGVLFDRDKLNAAANPLARATYLVDYGTILVVAPYTGAVLGR